MLTPKNARGRPVTKLCLALEAFRRTDEGRARDAKAFLGHFFPQERTGSTDRLFVHMPKEVRADLLSNWGIRGKKSALRDDDERVRATVADALAAGDIDAKVIEDGVTAEILVDWVPLEDWWTFWRGASLPATSVRKALALGRELSLFDERWLFENLKLASPRLEGTDVICAALAKDQIVAWLAAVHASGDASPTGLVAALGWETVLARTAPEALAFALDALAVQLGLAERGPADRLSSAPKAISARPPATTATPGEPDSPAAKKLSTQASADVKAEPTKTTPAVDVAKAEAPKIEPPKAEPPKAEPPKAADAPKPEPPKPEPPKPADAPKPEATKAADAPKAEPPKPEPPKPEPPKAEPPKPADAPKAEPPKPADAPKAEPPKPEPPKAEPPKPEPPKAEPPKADVAKPAPPAPPAAAPPSARVLFGAPADLPPMRPPARTLSGVGVPALFEPLSPEVAIPSFEIPPEDPAWAPPRAEPGDMGWDIVYGVKRPMSNNVQPKYNFDDDDEPTSEIALPGDNRRP
ncbi:MAG: hypothetical protein KF795_24145 [Labilithrix sp.]|nr:hypothetical protein [Labilithrix sp.]